MFCTVPAMRVGMSIEHFSGTGHGKPFSNWGRPSILSYIRLGLIDELFDEQPQYFFLRPELPIKCTSTDPKNFWGCSTND